MRSVSTQDTPASPLVPPSPDPARVPAAGEAAASAAPNVSAAPTSSAHDGTRKGAHHPIEPGLVDPAWTRLAMAGVVPVLLAVSAVLPTWVRLLVVVLLVPLTAQGWPALLRSRHDQGATAVVALTGLVAAVAVALLGDYGATGIVMALSVLASFVAQMARTDGRKGLVEDLSATVAGNLVMVSGAAWCALRPGLADPAVIVPCALSLFAGALLTVLEVRAGVLEALTMTIPALVAGLVGGALAAVGFFGPSHVGVQSALQTAAACLVVGFVAGMLMAVSNRVLWTHRWVPGGRAAVASAIVPILALGAPVYAIARLMGGFLVS